MPNGRTFALTAGILAASGLLFAVVAPGGAYADVFGATTNAFALRSTAEPSLLRVVLPDDEAEDAAVTANVKNAIAASVGAAAAQINVETRVAIVTLSGEAATTAIRDRAREAAWIVSGVRDVIDRIEVRGTA